MVIVILLVWKALRIKSVKDEYARREHAIIKDARLQLMETNRHFLKLMAKPYVWSIRTELLKSDINQINLYGNDIVKEQNFISVMVTDRQGTIISTTDKKFQGKTFASIDSASYLNIDSTVVNKVNDSLLIMASPIMSFNSKLGTLIIRYAVKMPDFSGN